MKIFRHMDIRRCDCELKSCMRTSDGTPITISNGTVENISILYNQNAISEQELDELLKTPDYMSDPRIICVTPEQADNLAKPCPDARIVDAIRNMSDESIAIFLGSIDMKIDANKIHNLIKDALRRKDDELDKPEDELIRLLQQKLN